MYPHAFISIEREVLKSCTIIVLTLLVSLPLQFCSLPLEGVIFKNYLFIGTGRPQAKYNSGSYNLQKDYTSAGEKEVEVLTLK